MSMASAAIRLLTKWLACCAREYSELRRPGMFGGDAASNCSKTLHVENFRLAEQSAFAVSGPAFFSKDGSANYWPLLPNLTNNLVIQGAITTLIGIFIGWVFLRLGLKKDDKASAKRPGKKKRRAPRVDPNASAGKPGAVAGARSPTDPIN